MRKLRRNKGFLAGHVVEPKCLASKTLALAPNAVKLQTVVKAFQKMTQRQKSKLRFAVIHVADFKNHAGVADRCVC